MPDIFQKMFSEQTNQAVNDFVAEGQQSIPSDGVSVDMNDHTMGDTVVGATAPVAADAMLEGVAQTSLMAVGGPEAAGAKVVSKAAPELYLYQKLSAAGKQ